ncbi:fructosamine kinase family protein [Kribbella solani]|uniref:fructosamine kinase family protein n=1 Tax=Kribbella solani TaxID=236067 RepID=UPI0029AFF96E|nr:fructosamine kinase family protein [Kribbella solani]MDX3004178.1 fructosamine kinase family protein [Kribbella solani]
MLTPAWLDGLSLGDPISADPLEGGYASKTYRVRTDLGKSVVVKTQADLPPDLYALEADGLDALWTPGGFAVPKVLRVTPTFIVLADLGTAEPSATYWADAGRALAAQHQRTADKFGYHQDNYLGTLAQRNPWMADGHAFFVEHRLLRFLERPFCYRQLGEGGRRLLERVVRRLAEIIPAQPPALLHGDLWHGNLLPGPDGAPAMIDPAVYYGWPEADLATLLIYGNLSGDFFTAYEEVHPLTPGWRERAPLLHLRELLSITAHSPTVPETVAEIHSILQRFD